MKYMVPVRRRNLIDYNFAKLGVNAPSNQVLNNKYNYQMPAALNHINRKLLLESKVRFIKSFIKTVFHIFFSSEL